MRNISVILTPELRMKKALKNAGIENPVFVTKLTVAGTLIEEDFEYIRYYMAETLQILDISKASVEMNKLPDFAFDCCSGLTSILLPDSLTEIGSYAFADCYELMSIEVPNSVKKIGERAFHDSHNLVCILSILTLFSVPTPANQ